MWLHKFILKFTDLYVLQLLSHAILFIFMNVLTARLNIFFTQKQDPAMLLLFQKIGNKHGKKYQSWKFCIQRYELEQKPNLFRNTWQYNIL